MQLTHQHFNGNSFALSGVKWVLSSAVVIFIVDLNYVHSKFNRLNFVIHLLILQFC